MVCASRSSRRTWWGDGAGRKPVPRASPAYSKDGPAVTQLTTCWPPGAGRVGCGGRRRAHGWPHATSAASCRRPRRYQLELLSRIRGTSYR
ncbi:hypothetical protein HBB16_17485 [Pseudonocardia sp. MCCB 268]|nr:hypothetical protein [Pseudonocardia cytotoxica]